MAQFSDIATAIANLNTTIASEKQQYIDVIGNLTTQLAAKDQQIADLQNQLNNVITSDQAEVIVSGLNSATTEVGNIVP